MKAATAVRERPILFSAPMVRAILAGTKSMTRRVIKPELGADAKWNSWEGDGWRANGLLDDIPVEWRSKILYCPFGDVGDRMWVQESFGIDDVDYQHGSLKDRPPEIIDDQIRYRADRERECIRWRHPRFMPRWASRITLEIIDVRVQRIADISEADAKAEGVPQRTIDTRPGHYNREMFRELWHTIHKADGPHGWAASPFVWAISFRRVER